MDNVQRNLLHWHSKLDHTDGNILRYLAYKGFLPKIILQAKIVKYLAFEQGKALIFKSDISNRIIKSVVKHPVDLMYMDHTKMSTPCRPLLLVVKLLKRRFS